MRRLMVQVMLGPFRDYVRALDALATRHAVSWLIVVAALVVTWFIYVPLHELLHAYGCIWAGGTVTRLEIAPEYGGALLARIVPFVVSGSAYAGQLTGFDTHGSDIVYLATVLAPYVLTIAIGVPLLRRAAQPVTHPVARPLLIGAALPIALAPFISITGDYYEAGSIVVTRLVHALDPSRQPEQWRSDDLFRLLGTLSGRGTTAIDWAIVGASLLTGLVLALLTYHCGALVARGLVGGIVSRKSTVEESQ
ncbi:MAG: hypothetical protein ABIS68_06345 [Casimicrobiaceae bacterium]